MIGLTGAPGAGKSTVAALWREAGCTVLDVDGMGHRVLEGAPVKRRIARELGERVLDAEGRVDRRALGALAFADPGVLRRLESIVHPAVLARIRREVAGSAGRRSPAVVLDCALLFESGLDADCDLTVTVHAPRAVRLRRVAARGWSAADLARRDAAQWSAAEKRRRADLVIVNAGSRAALVRAAAAVLDAVRRARRSPAKSAASRRPQSSARSRT